MLSVIYCDVVWYMCVVCVCCMCGCVCVCCVFKVCVLFEAHCVVLCGCIFCVFVCDRGLFNVFVVLIVIYCVVLQALCLRVFFSCCLCSCVSRSVCLVCGVLCDVVWLVFARVVVHYVCVCLLELCCIMLYGLLLFGLNVFVCVLCLCVLFKCVFFVMHCVTSSGCVVIDLCLFCDCACVVLNVCVLCD